MQKKKKPLEESSKGNDIRHTQKGWLQRRWKNSSDCITVSEPKNKMNRSTSKLSNITSEKNFQSLKSKL
jgi:hypothetical protein